MSITQTTENKYWLFQICTRKGNKICLYCCGYFAQKSSKYCISCITLKNIYYGVLQEERQMFCGAKRYRKACDKRRSCRDFIFLQATGVRFIGGRC